MPPAPRALAARGRAGVCAAQLRGRGGGAARGLSLPANAVPGSRAAGLRLGARGPPTRKARVRAQACRPTCVPYVPLLLGRRAAYGPSQRRHDLTASHAEVNSSDACARRRSCGPPGHTLCGGAAGAAGSRRPRARESARRTPLWWRGEVRGSEPAESCLLIRCNSMPQFPPRCPFPTCVSRRHSRALHGHPLRRCRRRRGLMECLSASLPS